MFIFVDCNLLCPDIINPKKKTEGMLSSPLIERPVSALGSLLSGKP